MKNNIAGYLLIIQFAVLVLPYSISKPATFVLIPLIVLLGNKMILDLKYVRQKFFLLLLLVPSFLMTLYGDFSSIIRFVPFVVIVLLFPYAGIFVDLKKLLYVSVFLFFFIVLTQFMIGFNVPGMIALRDKYYPIENNFWNYSLIGGQGDFNYRDIRFGGIFYNPNVCASNVFMYLVASIYLVDVVCGKKRRVLMEYLLLCVAAMSVIFSGSRTIIVSLIVFMVFTFIDFRSILFEKKILYRQVPYVIAVAFIAIYLLVLSYGSIVGGVFEADGSMNVKYNILLEYIDYCLDGNVPLLLFGGMHRLQFDADYGYIIGGFGLFGLLSVLFFYRSCWREIYGTFPFVFSLLFLSFGNSVIYNLAASLQVFIVLIIISMVGKANCLSNRI